MDDPADESFEVRDFNQTPLRILQQLPRDLAARLVRAVGGPDKLRSEIKNQRMDFDHLSPELQEAPKVVRRVSKHVLEITTTQGPRRFVDKPPHDEGEMAGVHWRYCGFNGHAKAHLIETMDERFYSGDLLLEETGQLMHAGHTVLFSPNKKECLAVRQEAGVDGENWAVHDMTGQTVWTGYAGTVANVDGMEMVVSTFERPQWTKQGELTTRFVCASSKAQGTVTLVRSPPSGWAWSGHAKCP